MPLFLISWVLKLKGIIPFIIKNWKLSIFILLVASNVYFYHKTIKLKADSFKDNILISELQSNSTLLTLSIESQNSKIEEGNKKYNRLMDKQKKSSQTIAELNRSLNNALSNIKNETIGGKCEDKIDYLRDSTKDLDW